MYRFTRWLEETWDRLRYAFQRAYRGYDDLALWNCDTAVIDLVIAYIDYVSAHGHGYPNELTNKKWMAILKEMKTGFMSAQSDEWFEKKTLAARKKARLAAAKKQKRAAQLLGTYLYNLWD